MNALSYPVARPEVSRRDGGAPPLRATAAGPERARRPIARNRSPVAGRRSLVALAAIAAAVVPAGAHLIATVDANTSLLSQGSADQDPFTGPRQEDDSKPRPNPAPPAPTTDDLPATRQRARDLLLGGKAAEAAALYRSVLTASPSDAGAMAGRVRSLIACDEWRRALDEARRFASAAPPPPDVVSCLGEALYRAGHLAEVEAVLAPLVSSEAAPARAVLTLGLLRVAEGRDDVGAALLARAVTIDPEDREVLLQAAGGAPTRARTVELLERYLARSAGDDADRIEGARGAVSLYKALGERPVWVRATRPARVEIPLWSLRDRTGRATGFVIEMAVPKGKPVRLLLDSGSTGLFLLERAALKAGVVSLAEQLVIGGGGDARQTAGRGLLASVGFGDLRFEDALATTTREEIDATGRYHGLLGLSVFDGYSLTLDLSRGRMILGPPPDGASGDPYWNVSGQLLVEATTRSGSRGLFLFDTGASASLLSLAFAGEEPGARLGDPFSVRAYGGPLRDARSVQGVRLRFQALEGGGTPMVASDLTPRSRIGGVEVSGYLGLDLLDRTRIVIDTRARRVSVHK